MCYVYLVVILTRHLCCHPSLANPTISGQHFFSFLSFSLSLTFCIFWGRSVRTVLALFIDALCFIQPCCVVWWVKNRLEINFQILMQNVLWYLFVCAWACLFTLVPNQSNPNSKQKLHFLHFHPNSLQGYILSNVSNNVHFIIILMYLLYRLFEL